MSWDKKINVANEKYFNFFLQIIAEVTRCNVSLCTIYLRLLAAALASNIIAAAFIRDARVLFIEIRYICVHALSMYSLSFPVIHFTKNLMILTETITFFKEKYIDRMVSFSPLQLYFLFEKLYRLQSKNTI